MKTQALPRVPAVTMAVLEEIAFRLGVPLDFVITAAVWAFCEQEPPARHLIVTDFWLGGLPALDASRAIDGPEAFKEKINALAAHIRSAFRRGPADHG
jgi:hypothetical protein